MLWHLHQVAPSKVPSLPVQRPLWRQHPERQAVLLEVERQTVTGEAREAMGLSP